VYLYRSEELNIPKSQSLLTRHHSQQASSPKTSSDAFSMPKRADSLKSHISLLIEQPKRLLTYSSSGSDIETTADSLAALCSCDPSTFCKVKLLPLKDEGTC